jgi:hypothetical protein
MLACQEALLERSWAKSAELVTVSRIRIIFFIFIEIFDLIYVEKEGWNLDLFECGCFLFQ